MWSGNMTIKPSKLSFQVFVINQHPLTVTSHTFNSCINYQFSEQCSTYTMSLTHSSLHLQVVPSMYS